MPKKPTRKSDKGMQDVRVSMPCEDAEIWEWLAAQKSVSRSVYYLISEAVRTAGIRDVTMSGYHGRVVPAKYRPRAAKTSDAGSQPQVQAAHVQQPAVQPAPVPAPAPAPTPKPQPKPKNDTLDSLLV